MIETSEDTGALAEALAKAQADIKPPVKNKTGARNTPRQYQYADLASVIDAVRGPLSANGLAVTQLFAVTEQGNYIVTRLMHSSGQYVCGWYPLGKTVESQDLGKAASYGRRYSLCAIIGVAAEDDDAESITRQRQAQQSPPKPRQEEPAPPPRSHATPDSQMGVPKNAPARSLLGAMKEHFKDDVAGLGLLLQSLSVVPDKTTEAWKAYAAHYGNCDSCKEQGSCEEAGTLRADVPIRRADSLNEIDAQWAKVIQARFDKWLKENTK